MNGKKSLKIILGILAVLLGLAALWRISGYEPGHVRPQQQTAAAALMEENSARAINTVSPASSKNDELLGFPSVPARTINKGQANKPSGLIAAPQGPVFITEKHPYPNQTPSFKQPYSGRRYGADNGRVVNTNFYAPDRGAQTAPGSDTPAYVRSQGGASPLVSLGNSAAVQEERAGRILAPFMRTNRKDQDRMNAQWDQLSAAIDRAVFQALMPKSKKDAFVEKYAAKPSQAAAADPVMQSSGLTGSFAPVGQAIAVQKQEIMKNFGSAFGGSAAQQAGSLMDAFAGELGSALNMPGLTQEQAAKRVKEISKKYQDKMNKLSEQKQQDKFMADRLAQDNQQKEALNNMYHDDALNAQFSQYIDTASQKIQELAMRTDLSQEEQSAQYAQIEQDKRFGIQKAITQSGQSLNPFYKWEQKQADDYLAKLKEKVENGEVQSVARVATPKETSDMQKDFEAQAERFKANLLANPHFGQAAVEEVTPIFDNYTRQLNQLYQEEQLSPDERYKQANNLFKMLNRELLQKQMDQVERMDIPDAQKQQALAEYQEAYNNIK